MCAVRTNKYIRATLSFVMVLPLLVLMLKFLDGRFDELDEVDPGFILPILIGIAMVFTNLLFSSPNKEEKDAGANLFQGLSAEKLAEMANNPSTDDSALAEACEKEMQRRKEAAERAKIAQERAAEKRAKRKAFWKKWGLPMVVCLVAFCGIQYCSNVTSDQNRFGLGMKAYDESQFDEALECFQKIDDEDSEYYSRAKYNIGRIYLEKKDTARAVEAFKQAVAKRNWDEPYVYDAYAQYCLSGELAPAIPKDPAAAVALLEKGGDKADKYLAGLANYEMGQYLTAYNYFVAVDTQSSNYEEAQGYLGIIAIYGLGGLERNIEEAKNYLKYAPEVEPFVVHKGDLRLICTDNFLWLENRDIMYARDMYAKAMSLNPERADYAIRYEIMNEYLNAEDRHSSISYWDRGPVYWDTYSFTPNNGNEGRYNGELHTLDSGSRTPKGWGYFHYSDTQLNMGHFEDGRFNGKGLIIWPAEESYNIQIGEYKDDTLVKGITVYYNGETEIIE